MRMRTLTLAVCLVTGGTAAAQPAPPQPDQPPALPQPDQPPVPPQPDPVPPRPQPQAPRPLPAPEQPATDAWRPSSFSIGIGLGYQLPTSLQTPNITSVRFRLPTGVTFEPQLVFATTSHTVDVGMPSSGSATEIGLGTLIRFPAVTHNRADLELLGSVQVDSLSTDPNDSQPDDVTSITTFKLGYGFAVTSWITPHWQVSLSATNPIVSYAKNRQETGPLSVTVTTDSTIGLIFSPTVFLMVHLYH
jgi:hypothetical protein